MPTLAELGQWTGGRPFKLGEMVTNQDGSQSTERLRTVQVPGGWANVPSLWMLGQSPQDLSRMSDDSLAMLAQRYEQATGNVFPRFSDIPTAEYAAKARSDRGGAGAGTPLTHRRRGDE